MGDIGVDQAHGQVGAALAACPEGRIEVLANYTAFRDLKKALSKEATNA